MTVKASGTDSHNGGSTAGYNYTASYHTDYVSSTTYKITENESSGTTSFGVTAWIHKDGTAVAVEISGQNLTGSTSQQMLVGLFAAFTLQLQADSQIALYTGTNFHSTGTSTVSVGPTQVDVTTYVANTLPETFTTCTGSSTISAFSFNVGTPHGASAKLVTSEHIAGSDTSSTGTDTFDTTIAVTSVTLA